MSEATFERLQGMIADKLGAEPDRITPDARLVEDLNMDDLDLAETMLDIETKFSVVVSDQDRASFSTVSDLVHFIDAYQSDQTP